MTATISNVFKKKILLDLDSDLNKTANSYYIGIGRSVQWNATDAKPPVSNTTFQMREAAYGLQSVKSAEDRTFTVSRNNWTSGAIYDAFNDNLTGSGTNPYYVITDTNKVYICLEASKQTDGTRNTSTVEPTSVVTDRAFKTSDGYVWRYLFQLTTLNANKFLSANFLPVNFQLDSLGGGDATLVQQYNIQQNAVAGQIVGIEILNGGTGFSSSPTITINGDGVAATATASVSGGTVTKIELDSAADSCRAFGRGYNQASVAISGGGGSGAVARPIMSSAGIGADARDDLKSTAMMFNTKPAGTETVGIKPKFNVDQDFRQVMLIRNPLKDDGSTLFTGAAGRGGHNLRLTSSVAFPVDTLITGGTSGAKGYVDQVDSSVLHIHQSDSTGYIPFQASETISGASLSATIKGASEVMGAGGPGGMGTSDLKVNSGDIYYLENRAAVVRSSAQTEDIKVVIQI